MWMATNSLLMCSYMYTQVHRNVCTKWPPPILKLNPKYAGSRSGLKAPISKNICREASFQGALVLTDKLEEASLDSWPVEEFENIMNHSAFLFSWLRLWLSFWQKLPHVASRVGIEVMSWHFHVPLHLSQL